MIILISVIGFYGWFVIGKKIKNIKSINQKALALDIINIDGNINTDNKNKILAKHDFLHHKLSNLGTIDMSELKMQKR